MQRITIFILATMLSVSAAFAQSTGVIAGRVIDQTGAALPGVTIDFVFGPNERTTVTDQTGAFRFDASRPAVAS